MAVTLVNAIMVFMSRKPQRGYSGIIGVLSGLIRCPVQVQPEVKSYVKIWTNVKHRLSLSIVMSMPIVLTQEGVTNVNVRLVMKPIAMTVPKARFHHPSGRTLLYIP